MELNSILQILARRKWVITLTTLATLAIVLTGRYLMPETYTATSTVRFVTARGGSPENWRYEVTYAERLMNTYLQIASSDAIQREAMNLLGQPVMPEFDVEIVPNTELMRISASSTDPVLATDAANELANMLVAQGLDDLMVNYPLDSVELPGPALVVPTAPVTVIERAVIPQAPSGFSLPVYGVFGVIGGLLASCGLAFLFENTDNRLHDSDQVEELFDIPVLGEISISQKRTGKLFLDGAIQGEEFRRLRTLLLSSTSRSAFHKTILVTSGDAKEGKSLVVSNLALAIARMGLKILIIDADMRRPTQHMIFRFPDNDRGLSNVLSGRLTSEEAIIHLKYPGLYVLPSGPLIANPADLMDSGEMVALLDHLRRQYDLILIDSPAYLHVPDVLGLSSLVDGVLVVIRSGYTQKTNLQKLLNQLLNQKAPLIGIVLNGSNHKKPNLRRGYYKEIRPRTPANEKVIDWTASLAPSSREASWKNRQSNAR